jgi:hypothetical protein
VSAAETLLQDLVSKASDKVGTNLGKWTDAALARRDATISALPAETQPIANAVADLIADKKDVIVGTSREGIVALTSRLALGQVDEAKLIWLRDSASFDERVAARDAASAANRDRVKRDEESWQATKDFGLAVLKAAGQAAIPVLLALI